MSPAFQIRSRTLFSTAAALVLGLQFAPWPVSLQAQEVAPGQLFVQAEARPISQPQRDQRKSGQPAAQPMQPPMSQPQQGFVQQQQYTPPQAPKSEVQLELEKLYQKNGRDVPEAMVPQNSQSPSGASGRTPQISHQLTPQQSGQQTQPQVQQQPAPQQYTQAQPASAPKKKGFWGKLFSDKNAGPTHPPAEPPYNPPVARPPMTPPAIISAQPMGLPAGVQNNGQILIQPANQGVVPQQPPQQFVQQPATQTPPGTVLTNDGFEAPLFEVTPSATTNDLVELGQSSPLPMTEAQSEDPFSEQSLFPGTIPAAPAAPANAGLAVEPDSAEQPPLEVAVEPETVIENPYSGLTLDEDPFSNPLALRNGSQAPREIPANPEESGNVAAEIGQSGTEPSLNANPYPGDRKRLPNASATTEEPPLVAEQPEATPPARIAPIPRSSVERTRAKQEIIASRQGLRGLKGFCPVALREERELVDAHSQFRAIYNGKTYYLSSSQAAFAFQSDPTKYAPAARGNDVIQQAVTGVDAEGSLDYAVWYKGRLYLFGSAETMDTFVSAPSSHSTLD